MSEVFVLDLNHVTVDGLPCGAVTDVLENYKAVEGIRGAVLAALQSRDDALAQAHAAELAALRVAHVATLAEKDALIDALGGTEKGQEMAREKRRQEIIAAIKRHEDELAGFDAAAPATSTPAAPVPPATNPQPDA